MLRTLVLLTIVLAIGVGGGVVGESRLAGTRHATTSLQALGVPHVVSPTPIPTALIPATPPQTLAGLASREAAFNAAPVQEVVLGKATNDANENLLWARLLDGVGSYARSPGVVRESASQLEIALNRLVPDDTVGYRVQDWRTSLGHLRSVEMSNYNKLSQPGSGEDLNACGHG